MFKLLSKVLPTNVVRVIGPDLAPRDENKIRWGIVSTANIARKNVRAMYEADNAVPVAVASRDIEKAHEWAAENGVGRTFGSYEELINSEEVDAVYIPMPTKDRAKYAIMAAEAGKGVLTETPTALNTAELETVLAACAKNRVVFMDATMFMHHLRLERLRSHLDNFNYFGGLRHITSAVTYPVVEVSNYWSKNPVFEKGDIRLNPTTEPLGVIGDLAWYNIRLTLWAFKFKQPTRVRCDVHRWTEAGVPLDATGLMEYPEGRTSSWHASYLAQFSQSSYITGSRKSMHIDDFVIPRDRGDAFYQIVKNTGLSDFERRVHSDEEKITVPGWKAQEVLMFERFGKLMRMPDNKEAEAARGWWGEFSLRTQKVVDACMLSAREDGRWVEMAQAAPCPRLGDDETYNIVGTQDSRWWKV